MSVRRILNHQREQLLTLDAELRAVRPISPAAAAAVGRARSLALAADQQLRAALRQPLDPGDGARPIFAVAGAAR